MDPKTRLVLDDFSGGRNGVDAPLGPDFQPNQVVDAVNGDWYRTRGFRKRNGTTNNVPAEGFFAGHVVWMGRHMPGTREADAEFWALDDQTAVKRFGRLDNSTTWTSPTVIDLFTIGSFLYDVTCASLNGLFFIAEPTGQPRLHVYDAAIDTIRRTGIDPGTNAPTVTNTGAGTYAAVLRYYRVRFTLDSGRVRSEATPSVSFTPSGAGTHARVTQPTVPSNESITQWTVEASADNVTFYVIQALLPIGTTFYDDGLAPSLYSGGAYLVSALTGTHTLQKAYRFIAAAENRLLGFSDYTAANKQSRLEISAVVGSRDQGDAERVDTTSTYYYDFDEKDSGIPTGLIGPLFGNFYPFKSRQFWELSPTGVVADPFRKTAITKELGMVQSHAGAVGEDAHGNPCIYFMSHRGFVRYGQDGVDLTVGRGIEDLILGPTSVMNMAATAVICHLVYHPDRRQVWVWFATGSNNDPDTLCVLNVRTGGWARYTGTIAVAVASLMFADTLGATMGFALKPYISSLATTGRIQKCDDTSVSQDAAPVGVGGPVSYQTYVTTRPLQPAGPGMRGDTGDALVLAPAASGVTITATITPDFGAQPAKTGTALLTASAAGESRVSKRLQDSALGGSEFIQITIGDGAAANNTWSLDRVVIPLGGSEPVS